MKKILLVLLAIMLVVSSLCFAENPPPPPPDGEAAADGSLPPPPADGQENGNPPPPADGQDSGNPPPPADNPTEPPVTEVPVTEAPVTEAPTSESQETITPKHVHIVTPEPIDPVITDGPWPVRDLSGVPVSLKPFANDPNKEMRRQAYYGPEKKKYPGAKSYRPGMVNSATAIFRDGDYILVDLLYHENEKRFVYFTTDSLLEDPPASLEIAPSEVYSAKTSKATKATMGPGWDYEALESTINAGAELAVFFEYNDWVFAEFYTSVGIVRAWLPADAVTQ